MKTLKTVLPHVLYMLVGGACGIFMMVSYRGSMDDDKQFFTHIAVTVLWLLLAFLVQIIIHEGGHLIFGLLTGYKFQSFRIGKLMLIKEDGRLKLKLFTVPGTAGQCLMFPPKWSENMPFRLYNLGGCIMNLVTGVLFFWGYYLLYEKTNFAVFFGALGIMGITNVIMNGIPLKVGGIANDGYNTLDLGKNKNALRAFWIQLSVNGLLMEGKRLCEMPKEWFTLPEGADLENAITCTLGVLKYNRDFDRHDFEAAEADLEYMLTAPGLLGIHKNELLCEQLFLRIMRSAPEEEIEPLFTRDLKKYMKATEIYPSRRRLWYAFQALYKKDIPLAEKALAAFEETAKRFSYSADILGEQETVEIIKEKAAYCSAPQRLDKIKY